MELGKPGERNLNLLNQYRIECETNVRALSMAESYYKNIHRRMGLVAAVSGWVGVFTGALEWFNDETPTYLLVVFLISSGGSSLLQTVSSYLNLQNRIAAQHTSCSQFNDLAGDIKLFLAHNSITPETLQSFVAQTHSVKDVFDGSCPFLPQRFWKEAKSKEERSCSIKVSPRLRMLV